MKRSAFARPLLMVGVLLLAILACMPGPVPSAAPTEPPPADTAAPVATEAPTVAVVQQFFTEGFDTETDQWSSFVVDTSIWRTSPASLPSFTDGKVDNMTVGVKDGRLAFDLESKYLWAYQIYDSFDYEDVRLDVVVDNRGASDNNVSLICRYSKEEGWYEFNIANNGLYDILFGSLTKDNKVVYGKIADGGSNKIKGGKDTNNYAISCKGRTLVLYINGYETRRIDDNQHVLRKGKVGLSVSSFNTLPVKVDFDSFKVSQP